MNEPRLDIVIPLDQKDIVQTPGKFILEDKFRAALLDTSKQLREQNAKEWSLTFFDKEKNLGVRFDLGDIGTDPSKKLKIDIVSKNPNSQEFSLQKSFVIKDNPLLDTKPIYDYMQEVSRDIRRSDQNLLNLASSGQKQPTLIGPPSMGKMSMANEKGESLRIEEIPPVSTPLSTPLQNEPKLIYVFDEVAGRRVPRTIDIGDR